MVETYKKTIMSYFSNPKNPGPGPIEGSALDGMRTRVAVSVKRILDCSSKQISLDNAKLHFHTTAPAPYTFVSAATTQVYATVSDLKITRLEERPHFARVQCNVTIPIVLKILSSDDVEHNLDTCITIPQDVVMYIPQASVFPFEVVAMVSCQCTNGRIEGHTCCCTACIALILKVIAETDLLIPTYGYCPCPKGVDYEAEMCNKFFDLPLYPSGK